MKLSNFIKGLCVVLAFCMTSCTLYYKPHVASKVQDQYTTYYVGEQGTQYFIKPLVLKAHEIEASMFIDFTFRFKKETSLNPVNCNFTLFSSRPFNKLSTVFLKVNDSLEVKLETIEPLRNKLLKNGKYECRYSSKINMNAFIKAFENNTLVFTVNQGNDSTSFIPNKETQNMIQLLNVNLFQLNSIVPFN